MSKPPSSPLLFWLDLEMTGLDPEKHAIIEIGTMVTDADLKVIARSQAVAIHQPEEALSLMDSWCVEHHGKSGLTDRVRASKVSVPQAETMALEFLSRHAKPGEIPLCGNSIFQDRRFLARYMPRLNDFFHYRSIDVSTIKELVRRWYPGIQFREKRKTHHVLDDIEESIEELRFYRENVFRA